MSLNKVLCSIKMTAMEPISAQRDADYLMLRKNKRNPCVSVTALKKYVHVSPGCKRTWKADAAVQKVMGGPPLPLKHTLMSLCCVSIKCEGGTFATSVRRDLGQATGCV